MMHLPPQQIVLPSLDEKLPNGLKALLAEIERAYLLDALQRTDGRQAEAARLLGFTFRQVRYAIRKHHLRRATRLAILWKQEEEEEKNMNTDRGFTLIEMLVVVMIVGILAAVAAPLYLGYVQDAKAAEAKAIVGAVWTATQSEGSNQCGTPTEISRGFSKGGLLPDGKTVDGRWQLNGGANTITVACGTGAITVGANPILVMEGLDQDIKVNRVALFYVISGKISPLHFRCTTDSTTPTDLSSLC